MLPLRPFIVLLSLMSVVVVPMSHGTASAHRVSLAADERVLRQATIIVNRHGRALAWLRRQHTVRDAERGADGRTITIHMRDGLTQAILPPTSPKLVRIEATPMKNALLHARSEDIAPTSSGTQRALVLAPFQWQYQVFATNEQVTAALTKAGFQTTELINSQVTVDVLKSIANYKVVYISGHAGWLADGTVFVSTGQIASPDGGPYLNDIMKGNMIIGSVAGDDGVHLFYDIGPGFVNSYVGHFAANSLVMMNGCGTSYSQTMWQALQAHGLSAYTGWTGEVNSPDMERGGYTVMYEMMAGRIPVGQAVDTAVHAGLATSEVQGVPTQMVSWGDSNFTLQQAAAPDPTATPIPPTATATATATATPKPTPTKKTTAPNLKKLTIHVSITTVHVGKTTPVSVTLTAAGYKVARLRVSLNGRSVHAGYHAHVTDASGIAHFREKPRAPGIIKGSVSRPHMKALTFAIKAIK